MSTIYRKIARTEDILHRNLSAPGTASTDSPRASFLSAPSGNGRKIKEHTTHHPSRSKDLEI